MTTLGLVHIPLFLLSTFLLNVTPGPDTAYVVGRSVAQGRGAGLVSAMGISAGCCVHVLATAVGLSAVLAASTLAFTVIKVVGALYLAYLGVRLILAARRGAQRNLRMSAQKTARSYTALFWQGFVTNVSNPKVAMFFLAFFPQFVVEGTAHRALAFLALGAIFIVMSTLWNSLVAWVAAGVTRRIAAGSPLKAWIDRVVGTMFIGVAAHMAASLR
jgi:threonine/homoserine/homoserine lactone efflux protein